MLQLKFRTLILIATHSTERLNDIFLNAKFKKRCRSSNGAYILNKIYVKE